MLAFIVGIPIAMHADHLRVEYLERPLAINGRAPRFSWWVNDSTAGAKQSAYQVQLRRAGGTVVWDSGKTASARQNQIESKNLEPETDYEWRVQLWDGEGVAGAWTKWEPFRTQLDWWMAPFIGATTPAPEPKPSHNGYHAQITKNADEEKWVEIDLGSSQAITSVTLYPAEPFDWREKVFGLMFPVSYRIEVDGKPVVDKTNVPMPAGPVELPFNASGRKVRMVVTKLRARDGDNYGFALAELSVNSGNESISRGKPATAKDSIENKDWSVKNLTNGDTTSHPVTNLDALPVIQLRKDFSATKKVKRALLYATALGAYEARLNGQKVGDHMLAPEWTDYHTRVQYQTYDVTKMIKPGANAIGALLGDGWYAGRLGMAQALDPRGYPRAVYGRNPLFSAELVIEYADGTKETVDTGEDWDATQHGPIRSSDILDGEVYDATKETPGWDAAGYVGRGWSPALKVVPKPMPEVWPQPNEPIRVTKKLKALARSEPKTGLQVFDMGQNMVGIARFKFKGSGKTTIRYGEMLNDDGTLYTPNLRGAPQIDTYIGDGKVRWFEPRFTYHGFRYIQIEGEPLAAADIEGLVFHSSSPEIGTFETSNPMVNRLWQNVVWTTRANLMSVPTDCPQRDERLGWTGDILAFGQTINYIMDMGGFTTKWIQDTRDAQAEDGRFPDFAPHPYGKDRFFTGVPGWGDAAVGFAHDLWENTGDTRILEDHFEAVKKYLGWIVTKNDNFVWRNARHNDYGDWLNGDTLIRDGWPRKGGELPKDVFGTLMWYQSLRQATDMARVLGKEREREREKFEAVARTVQDAFLKEYVDGETKIKGDTQAGYALALHLGILKPNQEAKAFEHLVAALKRVDDHMTTGFHSTLPLMKVLTRFGRPDLAYKLLMNKTFPSWGYTIENGATTIWERWDGYVKGRGFQDPGMNSFNHWALGAVGEWMFESVGGIRVLPPGSETTFRIAPVFGGDLNSSKCALESAYGRVTCEWKKTGAKFAVTVSIPANTTAEFQRPGEAARVLSAGVHRF